MKGKDGNEWIVKKIKNGSKKWIKVSFNKCNMILYYKKKIGGEFIHGYLNQYSIKFGKIENDKFYPWKSYNKFDKEENVNTEKKGDLNLDEDELNDFFQTMDAPITTEFMQMKKERMQKKFKLTTENIFSLIEHARDTLGITHVNILDLSCNTFHTKFTRNPDIGY